MVLARFSNSLISSGFIGSTVGSLQKCILLLRSALLFHVQFESNFADGIGDILIELQSMKIGHQQVLNQREAEIQRAARVVDQITYNGVVPDKFAVARKFAEHVFLQVLGGSKSLHLRI